MMFEVSAGKRRTRITVERLKPDAQPDESGKIDQTNPDNYETFLERWAKQLTRGGREILQAERVTPLADLVLSIAYDPTAAQITTDMRVRFGTRRLEIASIDNVDGANRELNLVCTEAK